MPRELAAYLLSQNDIGDTSKFEDFDMTLEKSGVRVTFLIWPYFMTIGSPEPIGDAERDPEFIRTILDHYNLRKNGTSEDLYIENFRFTKEKETETPDIFFFNAANAYSLYLQTKVVSILRYLSACINYHPGISIIC